MTSSTEEKSHFYSLLHSFNSGILISLTEDNNLHGRPMHIVKSSEKEGIYFFSAIECGKVKEIEKNPNINIACQGIIFFFFINYFFFLKYNRK